MSDCLLPDELRSFLAETLTPERESVVAAHLDECKHCQRLAEKMLDTVTATAERAASPCTGDLPDVDQQSDSPVSALHGLAEPPSEAPDFPQGAVSIPERIGDYPVLKLLAHGSTGCVYLATPATDRVTPAAPVELVAIKLLGPECVSRPLHRKRFERERNALAELPPHPNVVKVFDSCMTDDFRYLVMEYAGGQNLWQLLDAQSQIPIKHACQLTLQAAQGLEHIHAHGLTHRDIKPSNLIVDDNGSVKIVDFGIVHHAEVEQLESRLTEANTLMGTADFMAPEQATDVRNVGPQADIYSLGYTLAWLLTGRLVFEKKTVPETLTAHRKDPIPSLQEPHAEVPPALDALFQKMVAKLPEDRPATMTDVITELTAILNAPADVPPTKSPGKQTTYTVSRVCLVCLIVIGAFASIAAAIAFLAR